MGNFLLTQGTETITKNDNGKTALDLAGVCYQAETLNTLTSSTSQIEWHSTQTV
jgi:hypothetical protein